MYSTTLSPTLLLPPPPQAFSRPTSSPRIEPERLLAHSLVPATWPCAELAGCYTHPYKQFIRNPVILAFVLPVAFSLQVCRLKCFMHFWFLAWSHLCRWGEGPERWLLCYSVGICRQTQLVHYSGVFIVYLATCFGHLFGHLQAEDGQIRGRNMSCR
jgi:hypothetical protein